jgi:hypothetical protein
MHVLFEVLYIITFILCLGRNIQNKYIRNRERERERERVATQTNMVIILWVPQEPKPRITALTEPAAISPTEYLARVRVMTEKYDHGS